LQLKCTKFDFGWGSAPDPALMRSAANRDKWWMAPSLDVSFH